MFIEFSQENCDCSSELTFKDQFTELINESFEYISRIQVTEVTAIDGVTNVR